MIIMLGPNKQYLINLTIFVSTVLTVLLIFHWKFYLVEPNSFSSQEKKHKRLTDQWKKIERKIAWSSIWLEKLSTL